MICRTARTQEDVANDVIEKQLKADRDKILSEVKLLLLGTGESGKSTIAKQLKILHMNGFTPEEREAYRYIIHSNIIESTATLVRQAAAFGYQIRSELQPVAEKYRQYPISYATNTEDKQIVELLQQANLPRADIVDQEKKEGTRPVAEKVSSVVTVESLVNAQAAKEISELWRDPAIQQTYERKAEFQLPCSVEYLMEHIERLLTPGVPVTDDDALRCRMRTLGIVEIEFEIDGLYFKVVDVGGQRGERKKWFHCFASVTAVVFCVALNEYDEKLYEDHRVNRMVEAINLFKEVCNNKFFNDSIAPTSMIIFLNKSDLFKEKIKKVPLSDLFPDYKGGDDEAAGAKFVLDKLLSQNKYPGKLIFSHVTCATNTQNVRVVFNAVRTVILKRSLSDANIM